MKKSGSIRDYALALFELAENKGISEKIIGELEDFRKKVSANEQIEKIFLSPLFSFEDKQYLLTKIFPKLSDLSLNFILVLLEKKRFTYLSDICLRLTNLVNEKKGLLNVECRSAYPLAEGEKKLLIKHLSDFTGKKIALTLQSVPQLLAGIELRFEDKIWSLNLANQIEKLRHLLEASL